MAELLDRLVALELSYEDILDRLTALEAKADALHIAQERWVAVLDRLENPDETA